MSNYPDGVNTKMIDDAHGGPEDQGVSVSADQDREIEQTASATHIFLRVVNWRTGELLDDYALTKGEALALARAIVEAAR